MLHLKNRLSMARYMFISSKDRLTLTETELAIYVRQSGPDVSLVSRRTHCSITCDPCQGQRSTIEHVQMHKQVVEHERKDGCNLIRKGRSRKKAKE